MRTSTPFPIVLLLMLIGSLAQAAVPPEKRLMIERKIDDELKQTLKELVSEERVAERLGFELPVKEPKQTLSAVEKLAERRVRQMALEKFPDSWVDEQLRKMSAKYVIWKPGQLVTAKTKDGRVIRERLRNVNNYTIKIGPTEVRKENLTKETLLHVDQLRAMEAKNQDRNKLEKQLLALRESYARDIRLQKMREFFMEEGYIRIRGRWIPKREYYQKELDEEREKYSKLLRPTLAYKHYYNAGFRQFKEEWYTPEEAARLKELERIQTELQPAVTMALMDELNREFLGQTAMVTDDAAGDELFGEEGDGGGDKEPTGENPFE